MSNMMQACKELTNDGCGECQSAAVSYLGYVKCNPEEVS